jgi:enterochelin esterase-like enzyme
VIRTAFNVLVMIAALGSAAAAQEFAPASIETISAESRLMPDLPGPQANTQRPIAIWRPPSAPATGPLPTLYMADGANGLYVIAARLRPAIEAGLMPPIQVIGLYPDPEYRQQEYIERGRRRFIAHERWLIETVIPWAESNARASPTQRVIAGYSNGAAFALFTAATHPDMFVGVLAHSPVASADSFSLRDSAAQVRWALSAGRIEYRGYPLRATRTVAGAAAEIGAAVRTCTGSWGHDPNYWANLTPGAVSWLFNFPQPEAAATSLEREVCRVAGG